jgi:hypothetical protein
VHARLGPASLVLYDVSTLYFETDQGDGFREPGFSKERRLEPQITIGLLTGQDRFPLIVSAFEGNRAETKTMLLVIEKFMTAHHLPDVTVVDKWASRASPGRRCLTGTCSPSPGPPGPARNAVTSGFTTSTRPTRRAGSLMNLR